MPASLLAKAIGQLPSQSYSLLLLVEPLHHHTSADIVNLGFALNEQHAPCVTCDDFAQRLCAYAPVCELTEHQQRRRERRDQMQGRRDDGPPSLRVLP